VTRVAGRFCMRPVRKGGREGAYGRPACEHHGVIGDLVRFLRANPQVFILLLVCLILGIGTFLAVVFGILTAGSTTTTGQPNGAIGLAHLLVM